MADTRAVKTDGDAEIRALSQCVEAFETLDDYERQRVLRYLRERYGADEG